MQYFLWVIFSRKGPENQEPLRKENAVEKLPHYLTEAQVAARTGLGRSSLAKARCKGDWGGIKIPYVKIGRSVRYSLTDVEAFLEARRVLPAGGKGAAS